MKTKTSWWVLLLLVTYSSIAQTGIYTFTYEPSDFNWEGSVIKRANDANIVVGQDDGTSLNGRLTKMTIFGEQIWSTPINDGGFFDTSSNIIEIFCFPGDGYYCFGKNGLFHFSEEGELLSQDYYYQSDYGYPIDTFINTPEIVDVDFDGSNFHVVSSLSYYAGLFTTNYYYLISEINLSGDILFTNLFFAGNILPESDHPKDEDYSIICSDGYDYVSYSTDYLYVDKREVLSGALSYVHSYSGFHSRSGDLKIADGMINYGKGSDDWVPAVDPYLIKRDNAGDTIWRKEFNLNIYPDGILSATEHFKDLIQLPSGNLVGLLSSWEFTTNAQYRLIYFSPEGDSLFTTPPFIEFPNDISDVDAVNIFDMELIGNNLLAFSGRFDSDLGLVLLTDTLGKVFDVRLTGRLYNDVNLNGIFDVGEITFNDILISTEPGDFHAYSNEEGIFNLIVGDSGAYVIKTDSILYWDIINPADYYDFYIDTLMDDDTIPGFDFRFDYTVPVDDIKLVLYSSDITPGFSNTTSVYLQNCGNQNDASGTLDLYYPSILNLDSTLPAYDSHIDTSITWSFSGLDPYEEQYSHAFFTTDATAIDQIGDTILMYAKVFPLADDNISNDIDSLNIVIEASFDPNHKLVSPAGIGNDGEIHHSTETLTYTIEFQNTGTAEAHFINIYDTIDAELEITSIEMLSASHNYQLYLSSPNLLRWEFDSIFLPDSSTDLLGSMGYLKFRIKIKDEASTGDVIENTAGIYFDYNPPVITNTTKNTLTDFTESIIGIEIKPAFIIYPNPAAKYLTINLTENFNEQLYITITDLTGRIVMDKVIPAKENSVTLDISKLSTGFYNCTLYDEGNNKIDNVKLEVIR